MRDTKKLLLKEGHKLAQLHGLGHLTSKVMQETTGFYRFAVSQHYGGIARFRQAVLEYGIAQGTMTAEAPVRCPRVAPAERCAEILGEGYSQAVEHGLHTVTRASVAKAIGVSDGLVSRYFGTIAGLRDAVLARAVVDRQLEVVADAIKLQMSVAHIPPDILKEAEGLIMAA